MNADAQPIKASILAELAQARVEFHAILAACSEDDFDRPSRNPGWTDCEILAHIAFGFIIVNALLPMVRVWGKFPPWTSRWFASLLNALTRPFNWINALGARWQARLFTYQRIGKVFDDAYFALLRQVESLHPEEWQRGMYYPARWDANFGDFMTIEMLLHYPVLHFQAHREQIHG